MSKLLTWVVKASKGCNLRCTYCYEYAELHDMTRMPLETWGNLFARVRERHDETFSQSGEPGAARAGESLLVVHGGEPLILPVEYLDEVLSLKSSLLGEDFRVGLQTNCYRVTAEHVDLLIRHNVRVSVSYDHVPGIRILGNGRPTEQRVVENMQKLQEAGVLTGGISVIARHSNGKVGEIHDFWEDRGLGFRALPLFDGAPEHLADSYSASAKRLSSSMAGLFDHWVGRGAGCRIQPFKGAVRVVAGKMLAVPGRLWSARDGFSILHVNVNGDLFHVPESYEDGLQLGNVNESAWAEIQESDAYQSACERAAHAIASRCEGCEYAASCSGRPLLQHGRSEGPDERCAVDYPLYSHIEKRLREAGLGERELREIAEDVASDELGTLTV